MHLAVNALAAMEGGSATYAASLLDGFSRRTDHRFTVFLPPTWDAAPYRAPHVSIVQPKVCRTLAGRLLYEHFYLSEEARLGGAEMLYCMSDVVSLRCQMPCVVAARDETIYNARPHGISLRGRLRLLALRRLGERSLREAAGLVCETKAFLAALADLGLPIPKQRAVVHHGIPQFACDSPNKSWKDSSYVLYVGGVYVHKNLYTLLEAYAFLIRRFRLPHDLVMVGKVFHRGYFRRLQRLVRSHGLSGRVHFAGKCLPSSVREWYRNAGLMVLPSLQESFGYPILEAMAQNLPMVLSDIPVFQEVAGDAALYVEPRDAEGMAKAIHRVLFDEPLRERLRQARQERIKDFSVDTEIARLLDAFTTWSRARDGR